MDDRLLYYSCVLLVTIAMILFFSGCATRCNYSYNRWLRNNTKVENQVDEIVKVGNSQYIVTRDTVLGATIKITEIPINENKKLQGDQ